MHGYLRVSINALLSVQILGSGNIVFTVEIEQDGDWVKFREQFLAMDLNE